MNDMFYASIPALIMLGGVLWTLRVNQRNFETTRREEREKAREEREFTAKHRALLSAAEAVTQFINYYMTLPDRELPKDGTVPNELVEMGIALNRLHFYCGLETIKRSVGMSQVLSTSYSKALRAKLPSMFITEDIKAIDIRILSFENANNQLQQEILALLASDSSNPLLITHRQQLALNFNRLSELHARKGDLIRSKYNATEVCRDVIKEDLREVYEAVRNVLLMARRELAFPIDESAYATLINQSTDMVLTSIEDLYNEIRAQIRQKMERPVGRTLPGS